MMKKIFKLVLLVVMLIVFVMSLAIISMAEDKEISYKSTRNSGIPLKFSYLVRDFIDSNDKRYEKYSYKDRYFVLDNYDVYKYLGFSDKSKSFFEDNLLIINFIGTSGSIRKSFVNTGVTINDGIINVSYTQTVPPRVTADHVYVTDIIELKKSDVKGVDLTKQKITTRSIYMTSRPEDEPHSDTYFTRELIYLDAQKLIQKPSQVEKVKTTSVKNRQLKVTWKKIKGVKNEVSYSIPTGWVTKTIVVGNSKVKYEVKYSLKKSMKNAKFKKNIKNNKVTLKKLKSGKKYYIKVRAYQKIGNNTYIGKWSKKTAKIVK